VRGYGPGARGGGEQVGIVLQGGAHVLGGHLDGGGSHHQLQENHAVGPAALGLVQGPSCTSKP